MEFWGVVITNLIALYAAILSTYIILKERSNLNVSLLKDNYLSFAPCTCLIGDPPATTFYSNNKYILALHLRISNNSKSSTTINEFVLNNRFFYNSSYDEAEEIDSCFYIDEHKNLFKRDSFPINTIQPLLTLNPYSSIEGYVLFNNVDSVSKKIKLTIRTVQKSKSIKLKVDFYDCTKHTTTNYN